MSGKESLDRDCAENFGETFEVSYLVTTLEIPGKKDFCLSLDSTCVVPIRGIAIRVRKIKTLTHCEIRSDLAEITTTPITMNAGENSRQIGFPPDLVTQKLANTSILTSNRTEEIRIFEIDSSVFTHAIAISTFSAIFVTEPKLSFLLTGVCGSIP